MEAELIRLRDALLSLAADGRSVDGAIDALKAGDIAEASRCLVDAVQSIGDWIPAEDAEDDE